MAGPAPFFSVVIPTHNRRGLLAAAIQSVQAQTFTGYELIIVDDGSTDGTADDLARLGGGVRTIVQKNRGPAAARNAGARLARGTYVAFLDSDDAFLPSALASYARAIEEAGRPSLVSGRLAEFEDRSIPPTDAGHDLASRHFANYLAAAAEGAYVGSGHLVVRRDVFEASGGFDEKMHVGEDHDLVLRLGCEAGFVQITAPPSVARLVHTEVISRDSDRKFHGVATLVRRARDGRYGKTARAQDAARSIVGAHTRASAVALARDGRIAYASRLYLLSLGVNARHSRWRYLAAFPLLLAWHALASVCGARPDAMRASGARR